MSGYSSYWRTTIFASIAFHFLMALGFSYVLPHLMPEPTIEDVAVPTFTADLSIFLLFPHVYKFFNIFSFTFVNNFLKLARPN